MLLENQIIIRTIVKESWKLGSKRDSGWSRHVIIKEKERAETAHFLLNNKFVISQVKIIRNALCAEYENPIKPK